MSCSDVVADSVHACMVIIHTCMQRLFLYPARSTAAEFNSRRLITVAVGLSRQ